MPRRATRLVERDAELARLRSLVLETAAGQGRALAVEGPSGTGKTSLLTGTVEAAKEHGLQVVTSFATEIERELPYGVPRAHIESALRGGWVDIGTAFAGAARLALPVVQGEELGGAASPSAMAHAFFWAYMNLAEVRAVLVVSDDVHWADDGSLTVLAHLAARIEGTPLSLVAATRPERRVEAHLGSAVEWLRPAPLSLPGVIEAARDVAGQAPSPATARFLHASTDGNPFLLAELTEALRHRGVDLGADALPESTDLVPVSVHRRTVDLLCSGGPDARRLARALCVLGEASTLGRLAAVGEMEVESAQLAADLLIESGILIGSSQLGFRHPLVREAVLEDIPRGEARRMHAHAARLLEREGAKPEVVAAQLLFTDRLGEAWAWRALRRAARDSLAKGAPHSAARYLRRALDEPLSPELRVALLIEAGTAELAAGEVGASETLAAALRLAGDPRSRALAALLGSNALLAQGRLTDAVALLEETSAAVGEGDGRLRLLLEGAVLAAGQLDAKLGQDLAPRLERMRRSLAGDRAAPANALATTAVWTAMINRPAGEAAALAEQALRVEAAERDELALAAPSFFHACGALLAAEHYERVAALYDEAIAAAQADGAAVTLALGHSWRSLLFLRMGVVLEAEGEAELAARIHEAPLTRLFQPLAAAVRVEALIERGELDRAQEIGERSTVDLEAARSLYSAFLRFAIGRLRCAQGRYSDAAALLEEAGRLLTAMGVASPSILSWRSSAAIARLMSGDASEARALAREELVLAERFGAPRALVVAARTCGLIEAPGGDLRHLRRAVEVSADSPARLEHARSRVELGAALRRSGERREARDQLRPGLDLAASLGATALRDRALTELRAAGGRPRRIAVSGTDSLTASERRVAELAADGLTNRQIAQALYVTPRTVEGHLTQVYRKLDVPGRETLKAALAPPAPAAGRD